jgi:hypothetical protein
LDWITPIPPQGTMATVSYRGTDAGFRFTPSLYLQRTRQENRPWTGDDDDDDMMQQATRYDSQRKETTISKQFVNRVQKRKELYTALLNGTQETVDKRQVAFNYTASTASVKSSSSWKDEEEDTVSGAAARLARAKRLAHGQGNYYNRSTNLDTEKDAARLLRAQRLRTSLKATEDEKESQEQLQAKRAQQKAQEKQLLIQQEETEQLRIQQEQYRLQQVRVEEEQRRQQERLQTQQRVEVELRMQLRQQEEAERRRLLLLEEEEEQARAASALEEERKTRRHQRRHSDGDLDTDDLEWAWMESFQGFVRDNGLLKVCGSSCFGEEDDLDHSLDSARSTVPRGRSKTRQRSSNSA